MSKTEICFQIRFTIQLPYLPGLTHWGRVTHLCVSKLTTIGSDNGLSPGRRQAIIWTNVESLLIEPLWTNFSDILVETHTFSFKKMRLKISSGKRRPFCLGLNVLMSIKYETSPYCHCLNDIPQFDRARNFGFQTILMHHYYDVIMGAIASQITSLAVVYSTVYSAQIKENIKAPRHWPLCGEFYRRPVNSPHKWPVTRKMFPFDDFIMWVFCGYCHQRRKCTNRILGIFLEM